ncbi:MAG: SAM-dependent chlorinase/fluorinase [Cyanobacteria bacterium P01_F01_bin.86]
MTAVITLLTDFGYQDGYVGIMKGVIASICPTAPILDLTHGIPPHNIAAARFTLLNSYAYFPPGTIHTVVVDPGVGTDRRAIAVKTSVGYLIGPDNGVFSGVIDQVGAIAAVLLTHLRYWRTANPSATFHGRDIFAPVAAHLAAGIPFSDLGPQVALESLVTLGIPETQITDTSAIGHVQHIDQFGNIITTIPAKVVPQKDWQLAIEAVNISWGTAYGDVAIGQAVVLVGSHGWVEIAVNNGSAQQRFHLAVGDRIDFCVATS